MPSSNYIKDLLFGIAIGDAVGVPVEFKSREKIKKNPVTDMIGYGTYNLEPGTWSDDTSLTLCLAYSLTKEFNLQTIANSFVKWRYHNSWTARGHVFDVGIATQQAIDNIKRGHKPELAGGMDVYSNGNGSLMRILPLLPYIKNKSLKERYEITKLVSSITHAHIRSVIACFYYLEFAKKILEGKDKFKAYEELKKEVSDFLHQSKINPSEIDLYQNLLILDIHLFEENDIKSSGYVLHTLEASMWCILTTDNYRDAVLKAVNLGEDTDTTAAVTGGLAGSLYGFESIPPTWIEQLARAKDIEELSRTLLHKYP
ncbi:MAG: ADP-ribosylglycohydrolase family protein [Bacteroidetes bacterium]|jgi:ADP-ribosylglycohydrolase|nr:ADP-ribosylglycohydrolase family protein [Bacteroidota bacterium]